MSPYLTIYEMLERIRKGHQIIFRRDAWPEGKTLTFDSKGFCLWEGKQFGGWWNPSQEDLTIDDWEAVG